MTYHVIEPPIDASGKNVSGDDDLIYNIRILYPKMPRNSRRIASYFLAHPNEVMRNSITSLAQKVGTNPSTITRFCQTIGYAGFSEFRYRFELSFRKASEGEDEPRPEDSVDEIKQKLRSSYSHVFEQSIMQVDSTALERAVRLILDAKNNHNKIYIFGHGGSGYSAQLAQMFFLQIGISSYAHINPPVAAVAAAQMSPGDVALCLSSSGNAVSTVDAMKRAKARRASVIAITSEPGSLLAKGADVRLYYSSSARSDVRYFHLLKLSEIAVIGLLQLCVMMRGGHSISQNINTYTEAVFSTKYVY